MQSPQWTCAKIKPVSLDSTFQSPLLFAQSHSFVLIHFLARARGQFSPLPKVESLREWAKCYQVAIQFTCDKGNALALDIFKIVQILDDDVMVCKWNLPDAEVSGGGDD